MNLGMPEMIFIFLLALIIFGPKKLPEIGRQVGRFMNDFKRASEEFKSQIQTEIDKIEVPSVEQYNLDPRRLGQELLDRHILPPADPPQGTVASGAAQPNPAPVLPEPLNSELLSPNQKSADV